MTQPTKADQAAQELADIYKAKGHAAAQVKLDAMIAAGMKTFEYVVITDKFRQLVRA